MELVSRTRDFDSSDPRDEVFAQLNLANDIDEDPGCRPPGLRTDDTVGRVETFARFAKALIHDPGNLDILSCVNTFATRDYGRSEAS